MLLDSEFTIAKIRAQQMSEYSEQAKKDRLVAGAAQRRSFVLVPPAGRVLHGLGHILLAIGRRLDAIEVPPVQVGNVAATR